MPTESSPQALLLCTNGKVVSNQN